MNLRTHILKLAPALCLGAALLFAWPSANAQSATAATDPQQQPGSAYQNGFDHGKADAQSHLPSNSQPRDQWTSDDARSAYRQGYTAGYAAGSSAASTPAPGAAAAGTAAAGTAGAMANPSVSNDAARFGYQDGLAAGRKDKDGGHSFRPTDSDMYKNADHGWTADFGDKDHYKQLYRQSYAQGYQAGYGATPSR
jgi:hypothetical protein